MTTQVRNHAEYYEQRGIEMPKKSYQRKSDSKIIHENKLAYCRTKNIPEAFSTKGAIHEDNSGNLTVCKFEMDGWIVKNHSLQPISRKTLLNSSVADKRDFAHRDILANTSLRRPGNKTAAAKKALQIFGK